MFAWQGAGDDDAAEADVAKYVAGGLLPLHYGSIKYLPCYAAAGARIKLGYFDQSGKVCPVGPNAFYPVEHVECMQHLGLTRVPYLLEACRLSS